MTVLRICFVGDSITNGTADDECLGWTGRLCRGERAHGHDVTAYNLGVRAETSEHIRPRWRAECAPRLPDHSPGAIVIAFGVNDMAEENGALRCPVDRSLANARAIVEEARSWRPVLWVGLAPIEESLQPLEPAPGISYSFHNGRAAELSQRYAAIADELGVPFLDLFPVLESDRRFRESMRGGDGVHPTADGYAAMADIIGAWPSWRAWFDA